MQSCLVSVSELYALRNLVLRPGEPLHTTFYDKDHDVDTFHLAISIESKVLCIATFYPEKMDGVYSRNPYRLRGMATHPDFRRKSAATKLMKESFVFLKQKECDILWCNARLIAVEFYKSLGFVIGDPYESDTGIPHKTMSKVI